MEKEKHKDEVEEKGRKKGIKRGRGRRGKEGNIRGKKGVYYFFMCVCVCVCVATRGKEGGKEGGR